MDDLRFEFSRNDKPGVHPHNATILGELTPDEGYGNVYFSSSGNTQKEAKETVLKFAQDFIDTLQKLVDDARAK